MIIPHTEKAWAAGFFEGEGSVMLLNARSGRSFPRLVVELSQVDREPLDWLKDRWGGAIYDRVQGPNSRGVPYSRWHLMTKHAAKFLTDIEPFIIRPAVKEKIILAVAYQQQKTNTHENRTDAYAARQFEAQRRMVALNRRGAVLTERASG